MMSDSSEVSFDILKREHIVRLAEIAAKSGLSGISAETFEKELENRIAYYRVALCGGAAVGFAGVWDIAGEGEIIDVAVDPGLRRRGIGRRLMEDIIKFCEQSGCAAVHLEVRESNTSALRLYERIGFKRAGIRKSYYSDGENAVLMDKIICGGEAE